MSDNVRPRRFFFFFFPSIHIYLLLRGGRPPINPSVKFVGIEMITDVTRPGGTRPHSKDMYFFLPLLATVSLSPWPGNCQYCDHLARKKKKEGGRLTPDVQKKMKTARLRESQRLDGSTNNHEWYKLSVCVTAITYSAMFE